MGTSAAAKQPSLEIPGQYTWSFPGSPIKVQLALEMVERLDAELRGPSSGASKQGYLLGSVTGQTTQVLEFKAVRSLEPPSPAEIATGVPTPDAERTVGYYKVTKEAALRLNEDDIGLAESAFSRPYQVFLLIQTTESGPANATFFFWDEGRMCGDFPFLEFPLDAALLAKAEQDRIQTARKKVLQLETAQPAVSGEDGRPGRRRSGLRWVVWAGIGALLTGLCLAVFLALKFPGEVFPGRAFPGRAFLEKMWPGQFPAQRPPVPSGEVTPQIPQLGLQAQRQGGDLKVTWNRDADAIRTASSAVLSILADGQKREINLDLAQVRHGSIMYVPTADQVQMELIVTGPQTTVSESVIVLLPQTGAVQVKPVAPKRASALAYKLPAGAESVPPAAESTAGSTISDTISTLLAGPVDRKVPEPPPLIQPKSQAAPPHTRADSPTRANSGPPQNAAPSQAPAQQNAVAIQATPVPQPASPAPASSAALMPRYSPPEIDKRAPWTFPAALRPLVTKPKVVEVKVFIDEAGRVIKAEPVPSKAWVPQLMTTTAVRTATYYKFKPARRGDQPIPSEMILQFRFSPPQ
jgi:hypothetical protein